MLKYAAPVTAASAVAVAIGVSLGLVSSDRVSQESAHFGLAPPAPLVAAGAKGAALTDNEVIRQYCVRCHNERRLLGNMSLEEFDAADAPSNGELAEKMIPQAARRADASTRNKPSGRRDSPRPD